MFTPEARGQIAAEEGHGPGRQGVGELGPDVVDVVRGTGHRAEDGRIGDRTAVVTEDSTGQDGADRSVQDMLGSVAGMEGQRHQDREENRHRRPGTSGCEGDPAGDEEAGGRK